MAMMPWKHAAVETESEATAADLDLTGAMSDHDLLSALAEEGNPHAEKTGYSAQQIAGFLNRDLGNGQKVKDVLMIVHQLRNRLTGAGN